MTAALEKRLGRVETERAAKATPPRLVLADALFGPQLAFVEDPSPYSTAVCSRRAGKTVGCGAKLINKSLARAGSMNPYITRSRKNAKRILWTTLKQLNRDLGAGGESNESDLTMHFPNDSSICLVGANDRDSIEDLRGNAMALAVVDEAQSLPSYLKDLIDAVLAPSLMDFDGSLVLIGTPSPVPVGYFYDCAISGAWSHHHWTAFDNPHLERKSGKTVQALLEKEMARRGIKADDPIVQREWFGRWVQDDESLVFKFDSGRNTFTDLPVCRAPWQHVIGVDLGFDDADAIAVLAFNDESPNAHIVEEWCGPKQLISELAARLDELRKRYAVTAIVMDEGGLGKKIGEELRRRPPHVPVKAAEKSQKLGYIELVNDALRTGRLLARDKSLFAADAKLIEWDRDKSTNDRRVISDRFHSDIADAVLYAFRESLHWTHEPPQTKPPVGSPEHFAAIVAEMEAQAEEQTRQANEETRLMREMGWA